MSVNELLAELDRLAISVFYRAVGLRPGPRTRIEVGLGRERAYPELLAALKERTPELLEAASFERSRWTPDTFVRRPGAAA